MHERREPGHSHRGESLEGERARTPISAAAALDFYRNILGAEELFRMDDNGRVGHAEIRIGGRVLMLADEHPEMGSAGPSPDGASAVSLMLYVDDADDVIQRAVAAGATLAREASDQFYGDRMGGIVDPFGHRWHIATHIEDIAPDEMERRMNELHGKD
ncbi:MAG: VOC family protein [Wenzhouxiangellaceae bacterium]